MSDTACMPTTNADWLRWHRRYRGWTQAHIASALHCDRGDVALWECGADIPDDVLDDLEALFGRAL